jgi:hypothetical protein
VLTQTAVSKLSSFSSRFVAEWTFSLLENDNDKISSEFVGEFGVAPDIGAVIVVGTSIQFEFVVEFGIATDTGAVIGDGTAIPSDLRLRVPLSS